MRYAMICAVLLFLLAGCAGNKAPQPGVAFELAQQRRASVSDLRYALRFSLPERRNDAVTGEAAIRFTLTGRQSVTLDFRGPADRIFSLSVNGAEAAFQAVNEHLVIPRKYFRKGENEVTVAFAAADQSLNRQEEFLYTLLVPDRARTLFPCFDQPDLKARFTLTLDLPASWQAVSNGAVTAVDSTAAGRRTLLFAETEPLSTYLFAFAAGKFDRVEAERNGRTIALYHRETDPLHAAQAPDILDQVFDALDWLESYTGIPYPFAKYELVALPGFQYGGMEHTGATFYAAGTLFLNADPTLNERLARAKLIAHETAHMWFGDYVTMAWFDDVWTKEVFANYFATQMVPASFPEVNHNLNFLLSYLPPAYSEERTAGTNPIGQRLDNLADAGLVYGNIIYTKSPVVMDMLVRKMGPDAFREGIREYLRTYAYANATWDQLIEILDRYSEADLKAWSDVWIKTKGRPAVSFRRDGEMLRISQRDTLGRGIVWPQRVAVGCFGDSLSVVYADLNGAETTVALPAGTRILLPNYDGKGYGYFELPDGEAWLGRIGEVKDETARGSLLITLYENLLNGRIEPALFSQAMIRYLPGERNELLFAQALGYLNGCYLLFGGEETEKGVWSLYGKENDRQRKLLLMRAFAGVADTPEGTERLYNLWSDPKRLTERDAIRISYELAVRMPGRAEKIATEQLRRLKNGDTRREYLFVAPAVSPDVAVRDSVFRALLVPENRRVEPWAATALGLLNHRLRQEQALKYIRPGLEAVREVQRTGDIFFPKAWAGALLGGHTSAAARDSVEEFFADHPDYPVMLGNKIRQTADHLRRLH